jgi:hypothetical protein
MTVFKPGDVCLVSKRASQNYGKLVYVLKKSPDGNIRCISLKRQTVLLNRTDGTSDYYGDFPADWLEKLNVVYLPEYRKHVPEKDEEQDQPKQKMSFGSFREAATNNAKRKQQEKEERLAKNKGVIKSYRLKGGRDD